MLLKFAVSNFKSIGNEITFSMFPTQDNNDDRFLREIKTKRGNWKILRRGIFFGPNASGKTTIIDALNFVCKFVSYAKDFGIGTGVTQFKFGDTKFNDVTSFKILFYIQEDVFEYGFSLNADYVHEEWLSILGNQKFVVLYTRQTDSEGKTTIDIQDELAEKGSEERALIELLKGTITYEQRNQLFLYKLANNGVESMSNIVKWFRHVQFVYPFSKVKALPVAIKTNEDFTEYVENTLKKLDTGIFKVTTETRGIRFDEFLKNKRLPQDMIEEVQKIRSGIVEVDGKCFIFSKGEEADTRLVEIKFEHHLYGKKVKFDLNEESDGTKRLLDLLPMLFFGSKDDCRIYCVDEIDRSLHTKLSRYIISECVNAMQSKNLQIIFTAHDINLINLKYLRQDEIWFIEKNKNGESTIRPLSDFNIKDDTNLVNDYLAGRFGAVPTIGGKY